MHVCHLKLFVEHWRKRFGSYIMFSLMDLVGMKIKRIGKYAESENKYPCTIMVLRNILSIHYLTIPCNISIIDKMGIICMKRTSGHYMENQQGTNHTRLIQKPTSYICNDGSLVSYIFIYDLSVGCKNTLHNTADIKKTWDLSNFSNVDHSFNDYNPFPSTNGSFAFSGMNGSTVNVHPYLPVYICVLINEFNITTLKHLSPIESKSQIQPVKTGVCKLNFTHTLTLDITNSQLIHNISHREIISYCIYNPNSCKNSPEHYNGKHLMNCEEFQCGGLFKCPGYYCVPWLIVCNKIWDCPGGKDEVNCTQSHCTGRFKCHKSSICIPVDNICNAVEDCSYGDDEFFCPSELLMCPDDCTCIVYSISCSNVSFQKTFTSVDGNSDVIVSR